MDDIDDITDEKSVTALQLDNTPPNYSLYVMKFE